MQSGKLKTIITNVERLKMETPKQNNDKGPVKYQCFDSCNKCGEMDNEITAVDTTNGHVCECKTKCSSCGFTDYWAYGFFESGQEIESKAQTYSF